MRSADCFLWSNTTSRLHRKLIATQIVKPCFCLGIPLFGCRAAPAQPDKPGEHLWGYNVALEPAPHVIGERDCLAGAKRCQYDCQGRLNPRLSS